MDSTLPVFLLYAKRKNSKEFLAHIYLRVTYQDDLVERSLGISCPFKSWQARKNSVRGDETLSNQIFRKYEAMKQKILGAFYIFHQSNPDVSLQEIIAVALDEKIARAFSVYSCFEDLIQGMIKSKGITTSGSNIQKHQVCLRHLRSYVSKKYKWNDFPFARINRSFIDGFVDYMRTETGCCHNTTMKHLEIFKKIYKIALDNQWIRYNAFAGYKIRKQPVVRAFLTEEEINLIVTKDISIRRLDLIRDLFVFACFTGLAFIDVKNLKRKNIEDNLAISWIKIRREKTHIEATIPLLDPAKKVLDKWSPGWIKLAPEAKLLPGLTNQKTNAYLKEIADLCGISKPVSFHIGRHSFATSIALCNNIPIETVSKMLGHSRVAMTQHYSKVVDLKIAKDSAYLIEKYKSVP